jgi:hypothetical protein
MIVKDTCFGSALALFSMLASIGPIASKGSVVVRKRIGYELIDHCVGTPPPASFSSNDGANFLQFERSL